MVGLIALILIPNWGSCTGNENGISLNESIGKIKKEDGLSPFIESVVCGSMSEKIIFDWRRKLEEENNCYK